MKRTTHIRGISRGPAVAQSLLGAKLAATTEIIDLLILVPRQIPFKAGGPTGGGDNTDGEGTTNEGEGNNNNNGL